MNLLVLIGCVMIAFAVLGFVTLIALLAMRYSHWSAEVGLPPNRYLLRFAQWFRRWGRGLETRFTPPSERLLMLAHGHVVSQYMMTTVRLGIADAFERDARPAAAVAEELNLHPGTVAHMLRVLAGHGCFEIVAGTEHMVRHNSVSALLRTDHPRSLRPMLLMLAESYDALGETPQMAGSGVPAFVERSGGQAFAESRFTSAANPDGRSMSGEAMLRSAEAALFRLSEGGLLADYEWRSHGRIFDLSLSRGRFLSAILKANKELVGVVWDTPDASAATQTWWSRFAEVVVERVKFSTSESLADLPVLRSGDALLLGFVLSTLDDESALELLTVLRRQIGVLDVPILVADMVLEDRESARVKLVMDAQARGLGRIRHRTQSGWQALLLKGGFAVAEVTTCRGYASVIQASPLEGVVLPASDSEQKAAKEASGPEAGANESKPLLTPNAA